MYQIEIYEDAHDKEPSRTIEANDLTRAVVAAASHAESLAAGGVPDLQVGSAGEGELFEVFPRFGHGTVVVTRAGGEQEECGLDHTDGANLRGHPETADSDPWPVVFEDEPRAGYRVTCQCIGCGETIQVLYREESVETADGEVLWERSSPAPEDAERVLSDLTAMLRDVMLGYPDDELHRPPRDAVEDALDVLEAFGRDPDEVVLPDDQEVLGLER